MADIDDAQEPPATPARAPGTAERGGVQFDEEIYLRLNPDVRMAVAAGGFRSGRDHFERYGRAEGRPYVMPGAMARDRVIMIGRPDGTREAPKAPPCSIDAIKISHSGGIFIVGWVNDSLDKLDSLDLFFGGWSISFDGKSLARLRREDAEAALGLGIRHPFGFWGFTYAARRLNAGTCSAVVRLKSGAEIGFVLQADTIEDHEMRKVVLGHLAGVKYYGNPYFEAVSAIETSIGAQMVDFNKMLSRRAVNAPYVERFGGEGRRYKGSFVVCLYGKPEYIFLQQAMFARLPGIQDYEFIYISNSPHIAEQLVKEAKLCAQIYGLDMTLICLNNNSGFGAANNVAAQHANSSRLIIMNPDVFPHDDAWAEKHSALVEGLPAAQTALFGAPLYYDDGSLMHGGMYFCTDKVPSFAKGRKAETEILRVEHYGKGAPPDTAQFVRPRPVPAVTGAFMSVRRDWFEKLGGFTQDYVFGHYEDADLCLKSIAAGCVPWLHDVRLWHLEGKGSARRPQHEGGSVINRWLFTKTWGEVVRRDLMGQLPEHKAFHPERAAAPVVPTETELPRAAKRKRA